jgi:hypothetical protein
MHRPPPRGLLTAIHAKKIGEELNGEERWRTIKQCRSKGESGKKLGFFPIQETSRNMNDAEQETCSKNKCGGYVSEVRRIEEEKQHR